VAGRTDTHRGALREILGIRATSEGQIAKTGGSQAGHWVGMGHTDSTDLCVDQTMYPSISSEDSTKRVLDDGDTTGISALYG
jgi:hypothetical protein